jgi:hypothetical protein
MPDDQIFFEFGRVLDRSRRCQEAGTGRGCGILPSTNSKSERFEEIVDLVINLGL